MSYAPVGPGERGMADELLGLPREWLDASGEIGGFMGETLRDVLTGRVLRFFGETLRQAGILIIGSTGVIWGLAFITGLGPCGIQGAYFSVSTGTPAVGGLFAALCDLREAVPLTFGYMMSAKVGTGIVAELGAMRISEEIDALEVMGVNSMTFLCATRLLASWLVLPFMYIGAIGIAYLASYIAVVDQVGYVSSGGYLLLFWEFQNPGDFLFSVIKGMTMATAIVLVGCYYGYTASGGPVGVGRATAKSMALNLVLVNLIDALGTQIFWGSNPRSPIGG
jgi:phospholipid/cholesterol/gamma-HCH transport system permease protein